MEVWGKYELGDGDMLHGGVADRPSDASRPDFEARVHGDGISGDYVLISSANTPRAVLNVKYWYQVVRNTAAFRNLRNEILQGFAWPKMLANIRAESRDLPPLSNQDKEILQYLVKHHYLNPSQASAVRQVLEESCITAVTGGAGTGKSETLVACIKAVLRHQRYIVAQNTDPADLSTINPGRRVGGLEGDNPPPPPVMRAADCSHQYTSGQLAASGA